MFANSVPESQSPKLNLMTMEIFDRKPKKPCLRGNISEIIQLNQERLLNLLTNFLCSFQIRKDPTSCIGTLIHEPKLDNKYV